VKKIPHLWHGFALSKAELLEGLDFIMQKKPLHKAGAEVARRA